jgi:hypothetical protein
MAGRKKYEKKGGEEIIMPRQYSANDPQVIALLEGVLRSGRQTYCRINADGVPVTVPIRRELMEALNICSKSASRILNEASIPDAPMREQPPEREPDPEAVILAAIAEAAKEMERKEKIAKKTRAEEAAIARRYSLVRQGSYHGVYNEETASQVLFHTMEEARQHLFDLMHDREAFNSFYGGRHNQKVMEPQSVE